MPQIKDSLPNVQYDLVISFEYIGEIGEYDIIDDRRAEAWRDIERSGDLIKQQLIDCGAVDSDRIDEVSVKLHYIGETTHRELEPAYNHGLDTQRLGKE